MPSLALGVNKKAIATIMAIAQAITNKRNIIIT
jgi:hypothetical protein